MDEMETIVETLVEVHSAPDSIEEAEESHSSHNMPEEEEESEGGVEEGAEPAWVGAVLHRIEGRWPGYFPRYPRVTVTIIDDSGQLITSDAGVQGDKEITLPCTTAKFNIFDYRGEVLLCDELLVLGCAMSRVNRSHTILFDLTDTVLHKNKTINMRIAWAFLKPVAADGSTNTGKQVRLQLYKPRKSCARVDHTTCDVFHLYSVHKLKKRPGSLWVTVMDVQRPTGRATEPGVVTADPVVEEDKTEEQAAQQVVTMETTARWSRLPGQSCKIPNHRRKEFHLGRRGASCVAFNHNGHLLAIATGGAVLVYDVVKHQDVARLAGHTGLVYDLHFSTDDEFLLTVSADGTALVWVLNPIDKIAKSILPHPTFVYCGRWFSSGERLVTGCKDHVVRCWSWSGTRFELSEELTGHTGFVSALLTAGDDVIISGDSVGWLLVRRLQDAQWVILTSLRLREVHGCVIDALHLHAGRKRVVLTARSRGSFLVDMSAGVVIQTYRAHVNVYARSMSCVTPCGSFLWAFTQNNAVAVWEINTGKNVATYDCLFAVTSGSPELSGAIAYHPHDHAVALALLGAGHPIVVLDYSAKDDESNKLGLVVKDLTAGAKPQPLTAVKPKQKKTQYGAEEGDKLASLVRKIDKVFTAKRSLQSLGASIES